MSEVNLNYINGYSCKVSLDDPPVKLKFVDDNNNLLHLFELVESDHYFEIPEMDTNTEPTHSRWQEHKNKFHIV